jgi:phospho-N-acetylmuramoyl-pentapeptide-transferase
MLHWLWENLGINIFHYITVRALIGFFVAFFLTIFVMPFFINWAKSKKMRQPIYEHAPKTHEGKKNTPTMGGLVFMFATLVAVLICANVSDKYIITSIFIIISFTAIGFTDDIGKITGGSNTLGISPRAKLIGQFAFSMIAGAIILFLAGFPTTFYVPFLKSPILDFGLFAIVFWALVMVSSSNAVNLTDGLDGLAAVPSVFAFISLGVLIYVTGNAVLSSYLLMPKVIGVGELTVVSFSMVGALLGFLWYNSNPAEVFMGDTGSLPIGALIGFMAVVSKSEILLLAIGFIFVIETLSVIIQVTSYRSRGKRVFLMAPIHHHFEMKRWAENKIIVRFWIISLLSNIIALLSIKIR